MKTTFKWLSIYSLSVPAALVFADDTPPVDTTNWACKYCAFEQAGFNASLDVGLGYVSDDSYKFGEYNGMHEKGLYLISDASIRMRGENANYWNLDLLNSGLDSRSLNIEGGKQGAYTINFNYTELPHYGNNTITTPFLGIGSDTLTLPGTWVRGVSTSTMTDLANSQHSSRLETKRKQFSIGSTLIASSKWDYAVKYRHEVREGTQATGSAFFFNSAQLIAPVDYETQQIDVSTSYTDKALQIRLAYYASLFKDNNTSLTWDNPYSSANGADTGQLALPPDNAFHQLSASVGYTFNQRTQLTADIAIGRMTQNEDFVPVTTNSSLAGYPFALPRTSLDGLVDTLNGNIKLTTKLSPDWGFNLAYIYNDHDDKTPQAAYTWVTTDTNTNAVTRTNTPYSFSENKIKLSADYRIDSRNKISVGLDNERDDRTYQAVSKSTENTLWSQARLRVTGKAQATIKLAHSVRDIDSYEVLPWLNPAENPLLRKYNMADRERDEATMRLSLLDLNNISLGFGFGYANDDYTNSSVGLISSQRMNFNTDMSIVLSEKTNMYVFVNHEEIDSRQAGSSTATIPDWTSQNKDTINSFGIGVKHKLVANKMDIGADVNITDSKGKVRIDTGSVAPEFPDIATQVKGLKLYASYKLQDNLTLKGTYWYEKFDSQNWAYDSVTASTIPNLLSLGQDSPDYSVSIVMLSLRYTF